MKKFRSGAASFYMIAFSTLILLILAVSFAAVIVSEIERTSNDDLSQSAYDSALAGIEDAKLAYHSYLECRAAGASSNECKAVVALVDTANPKCSMVGEILGRTGADEEVLIEDSREGVSNNMQQAYTCVKLRTILNDYRATLTSAESTRVIKVKFANDVKADDIETMKLSWYIPEESNGYYYTNFIGGGAAFPKIGSYLTATPPTVSLALVQTAKEFTLGDFSQTSANRTNLGMMYFVPSGSSATASSSSTSNEFGAYKGVFISGKGNYVSKSEVVKSNDKKTKNTPYAVYCPANSGEEFACSVTVELPKPFVEVGDEAGGKRNDDTFMFVVSLPYGRPDTDFSLEFFCKENQLCASDVAMVDGTTEYEEIENRASLDGVQVQIDSTGRANDLYRRIETRMESSGDESYLSLMGPLQLLGSGNNGGSSSEGFIKNYTVTHDEDVTIPVDGDFDFSY